MRTTKKRGAACAAAGGMAVAGLWILATVRPSAADAPMGRFTAPGDGTVTDNQTKLVWQQTAPAGTYTPANAMSYCTSNTAGLPGSGWRLPSVKELQTIVDRSRSNPAIDPTAFPSTPADIFWTSSASVGSFGSSWFVLFTDGETYIGGSGDAHYVRCVR